MQICYKLKTTGDSFSVKVCVNGFHNYYNNALHLQTYKSLPIKLKLRL